MAYGLYVAKRLVHFEDENGNLGQIPAGSIAHKDHPIMKGRKHFFEPLKVDYDTEVAEEPEPEQEVPVKRGPGRPRRVQ